MTRGCLGSDGTGKSVTAIENNSEYYERSEFGRNEQKENDGFARSVNAGFGVAHLLYRERTTGGPGCQCVSWGFPFSGTGSCAPAMSGQDGPCYFGMPRPVLTSTRASRHTRQCCSARQFCRASKSWRCMLHQKVVVVACFPDGNHSAASPPIWESQRRRASLRR